MKKLIALMLVATFTGAIFAQQNVPQSHPQDKNVHDDHRGDKDKKKHHHHRRHHEEHKQTDKK